MAVREQREFISRSGDPEIQKLNAVDDKKVNDHWKEGQKLVNWEVSVAITHDQQTKIRTTPRRDCFLTLSWPIYMKCLSKNISELSFL